MSTRPAPQCVLCVHWRSPLDTGVDAQTCAAFPDGIPAGVWNNRVDHRNPVPGDGGVRWAPRESGDEFPDWGVT
jgi:hypothetical protein